MLDFTNSKKVKVNNSLYDGYYYEYQEKIYYLRYSPNFYELLISKIAEYLEIESVSYQLATKNHSKYIISENFIQDGINFKDGYDIISDYQKKNMSILTSKIENYCYMNEERFNNLEDLSIVLKEAFQEDSSKMMESLNNIFSFDMIVGYSDRQSPNWGVLYSSLGAKLAPMYDGKWSFSLANPALLVSHDDRNKSLEDILYHFLNTADSSCLDNFIRYYKRLNTNRLKKIIFSTEKENGICYDFSKICRNFENRRDIITKVLKK